jgi:hypothetical protein
MFTKSGRDERTIYGKALSVTDAGIMFDGDREGPFHDPDPKLYPLDQVVCVVDSAQNVLYGTLPEGKRVTWDMDIVFRRTDDTTAEPLKFVLHAGEPFSFCVPPGSYAARAFLFNQGADIAAGELIPSMSFTVLPKRVNYIGEIRVDVDSADAPGVCVVPYKMIKTGSTGWGGMFGLVGGLVEGLTTDYGIQGGHRLRIQNGEAHTSALALPVEATAVTLTANPMMPPLKERK